MLRRYPNWPLSLLQKRTYQGWKARPRRQLRAEPKQIPITYLTLDQRIARFDDQTRLMLPAARPEVVEAVVQARREILGGRIGRKSYTSPLPDSCWNTRPKADFC